MTKAELVDEVGRQAVLDVEHAAVLHHGAGRLRGAVVVPARRIARLLQVHAEVDDVDDDLRVALTGGLPGFQALAVGEPRELERDAVVALALDEGLGDA